MPSGSPSSLPSPPDPAAGLLPVLLLFETGLGPAEAIDGGAISSSQSAHAGLRPPGAGCILGWVSGATAAGAPGVATASCVAVSWFAPSGGAKVSSPHELSGAVTWGKPLVCGARCCVSERRAARKALSRLCASADRVGQSVAGLGSTLPALILFPNVLQSLLFCAQRSSSELGFSCSWFHSRA